MKPHARTTSIDGVMVIEARAFGDQRGFFAELWRANTYEDLGLPEFVQDNAAFSSRRVLRGLHAQNPNAQGKLVSALFGEVYDVLVDIRPESPTFGRWEGHRLSAENHLQLWAPPGLAHGYQVLSEHALLSYKCTNYYDPSAEICLLWNDPDLGIEWPLPDPLISDKDRAGLTLRQMRTRLQG